jgi:hypothetical protein
MIEALFAKVMTAATNAQCEAEMLARRGSSAAMLTYGSAILLAAFRNNRQSRNPIKVSAIVRHKTQPMSQGCRGNPGVGITDPAAGAL